MTPEEWYQILDLEPGSSLEDVKAAYRQLAKVWHPDRFPHDPQLALKATEKLKKINHSYEELCRHLENEKNERVGHTTQKPPPSRPEPTPRESKPPPHPSAAWGAQEKSLLLSIFKRFAEGNRYLLILTLLFCVTIIFVIFRVARDSYTVYPGEPTTSREQATRSGLRYIELGSGNGPEAVDGMMVSVHYTGYLMDGRKFDSSHDRDEPIRFVLGSGQVIKGWDEGISSMRTNQRRKLIIPPHLAYGDQGMPGVIPPNAELVFDVELVAVTSLDD